MFLLFLNFLCFVLASFNQMMWALEYDPDMFLTYEEPELVAGKSEESKAKAKSRHVGKYERENMKNAGKASEGPLPISVFLVASVLKDKSTKLLTEARGLDDVVKVFNCINFKYFFEVLNLCTPTI